MLDEMMVKDVVYLALVLLIGALCIGFILGVAWIGTKLDKRHKRRERREWYEAALQKLEEKKRKGNGDK